jgi:hypothetical protein
MDYGSKRLEELVEKIRGMSVEEYNSLYERAFEDIQAIGSNLWTTSVTYDSGVSKQTNRSLYREEDKVSLSKGHCIFEIEEEERYTSSSSLLDAA